MSTNPFDGLSTETGPVELPALSGKTEANQIPTSVQNFTIPSLQQTANEVLLKMNATGVTDAFTSFTESVCKIPAALPDYVSSAASSFFPTFTNIDFSPKSINETLGKFSLTSRKNAQPITTTEAQQLKELRKTLRIAEGNPEQTGAYKVKLTSTLDSSRVVVFEVTPTFTDTRTANYTPLEIIHHPGQIQVYKTTESRSFQLQGRLISNTSEEATINVHYMDLIRSWTMPFYGSGTEIDAASKKHFGAPPEVLWFSAYGKHHFEKIPVVVTSYAFTYDEQYDMIPAGVSTDGPPIPMPVIMAFTVDIRESYSPSEFSSFDLRKYRDGDIVGAFLSKGK